MKILERQYGEDFVGREYDIEEFFNQIAIDI